MTPLRMSGHHERADIRRAAWISAAEFRTLTTAQGAGKHQHRRPHQHDGRWTVERDRTRERRARRGLRFVCWSGCRVRRSDSDQEKESERDPHAATPPQPRLRGRRTRAGVASIKGSQVHARRGIKWRACRNSPIFRGSERGRAMELLLTGTFFLMWAVTVGAAAAVEVQLLYPSRRIGWCITHFWIRAASAPGS
jgi:hypothetical protein